MIRADLSFEKRLWAQGYRLVAGLDEVGRGSWVGPVVAAAVILPPSWKNAHNLADSKLLNSREREELAGLIAKEAVAFSIAEVGLEIINREGIGRATQRAFRLALRKLSPRPEFHLVDAFYVKYLAKYKQLPIIKGDQKSASIAAASIVAKVYRDRLMTHLGQDFPEYGWGANKGYGTRNHQEAIRSHGFSPLHRSSFNLSYLLVDSLV